MSATAMDRRFGIEVPVVQTLSPEWMKRVWADHAVPVGEALKEAFMDVFGYTLRATAACSVGDYCNSVGSPNRGYAIVNWGVEQGKQWLSQFNRNAGRNRSASGAMAPKARMSTTTKNPNPGQNGPNGVR